MEVIKTYSMVNPSGARVVLSNLGAGIISVIVPDAEGRMDDVVLGYENPDDYLNDGPCMGKVPGRFANRIAGGRFVLDGKVHTLAINNGPNHLHGGPNEQSYANRLWDSREEDGDVIFSLDSPDGDAGYPGGLKVEVRYSWSGTNDLSIRMKASCDAPTVINLTNHTYFNLKGETSGNIRDHLLRLNASRFLPTDSTLIPSGELAPVEGTPMDFTSERIIGTSLDEDFPAVKFGKGYDSCWAVDDWKESQVVEVAELKSADGARRLIVSSDAPGVQIYTGNWLKGSPKSKSGREYEDYDGVAIECQSFPDSPNRPAFPSTVLRPGETYTRTVVFSFR